jgi:hypothetical protein
MTIAADGGLDSTNPHITDIRAAFAISTSPTKTRWLL